MKNNRKGFTLAELLVVVAIIAVLVAIAIPVFTSQTEKAKQAVDAANLRAAYAEAMVLYLDGDTTGAKSEKMVHTGGFDKLGAQSIGGVPISGITVTEGNQVTVTIDASGNASFN